MKQLKIKAALSALMVAATLSVSAQVDYSTEQWAKYGTTPAERETNVKAYSFFNEEYAIKDYANASQRLQQLVQSVPALSVNLYIKGTAMYKNLLVRSRNLKQRAIYGDSIMILHNLRLENFGSDAKRGSSFIKGQIVKDYISYINKDAAPIVAAMNDAVATEGAKLDADIAPVYFNYLVTKYGNDEVETTLILDEFSKMSDFVASTSDEHKDLYLEQLEKLLLSSGAASCENLEALFKPQYEAEPENKELIAKILRQLSSASCPSDFQLELAEKYYTLEPTADAAATLAATFEDRGDVEKASFYYDEAIGLATENSKKVAFALSAAGVNLIKGNKSDAIKFSRKAISIDPESGLAYFLLAQTQAQMVGCGDEFQRQAAYWIIVDNLQRAKRYIAEEQVDQVQKAINAYSGNFPVADEIFFRELQAGDSYTVNCGAVSGTTTVRVRGR